MLTLVLGLLYLHYRYCLSGLYSDFLIYWAFCYNYTIGTVFQGYTLIFSYTGHFPSFLYTMIILTIFFYLHPGLGFLGAVFHYRHCPSHLFICLRLSFEYSYISYCMSFVDSCISHSIYVGSFCVPLAPFIVISLYIILLAYYIYSTTYITVSISSNLSIILMIFFAAFLTISVFSLKYSFSSVLSDSFRCMIPHSLNICFCVSFSMLQARHLMSLVPLFLFSKWLLKLFFTLIILLLALKIVLTCFLVR